MIASDLATVTPPLSRFFLINKLPPWTPDGIPGNVADKAVRENGPARGTLGTTTKRDERSL